MIFVPFRPKNRFDTINSYQTRIGGQFDTDITSVFNVTHECIQLVKSATVYFTSNVAGIFIGSFSGCSPQINNLGKNFMGPSPRNFNHFRDIETDKIFC